MFVFYLRKVCWGLVEGRIMRFDHCKAYWMLVEVWRVRFDYCLNVLEASGGLESAFSLVQCVLETGRGSDSLF